MSYVPATFTAGFALALTAAGAVGGQWVSDLRKAAASSVTAEVRVTHEPPSTARAVRTAIAVRPATASPAAPSSHVEVAAPLLRVPISTKLREPIKVRSAKPGPGSARVKPVAELKKLTTTKAPGRLRSEGVPLQARFDAEEQGGRKVSVRN
jgi:hypothetical protein